LNHWPEWWYFGTAWCLDSEWEAQLHIALQRFSRGNISSVDWRWLFYNSSIQFIGSKKLADSRLAEDNGALILGARRATNNFAFKLKWNFFTSRFSEQSWVQHCANMSANERRYDFWPGIP
jgi:hypothetical protein